MQLEGQQKCQNLNLDDNKKNIKKLAKEDQKEWMSTFTSTSRTIYRGCWFFDFIHEIFRTFVEDRKAKLSTLASAAYYKALGPHHGMMLRSVAGIAMKAVNYKETFISNFTTEQSKVHSMDYTEEMMYNDVTVLAEEAGKLAAHLWAICRANGFDKLP